MYPLHLNYITTLPCKTVTMKITIFIIMFYWNLTKTWKFDISDCHSLLTVQNPVQNSFFQDVSKVSAPSFHTRSKSFYKAEYGFVDGVMWQIIPYCLQDFLQLVYGIWLGLKCLVAFKHSSPDMVIKRIKVWWVWWPFFIIIHALPKKSPVKNCNFHSDSFTR